MAPDPVPRDLPCRYQPYVWPGGERVLLAPRSQRLDVDLVALMEQRQTRREFTAPLGAERLGEFLWLSCRNRSSRASPYGPDQESRVHPSAGAMHPVHVLLSRTMGPWWRYDPVEHALLELPGSAEGVAASRDAAGALVELRQGILIGLVAEPGKTAAKYANHQSLVWRDAGVVLGYMSLIAEALGLSFCPLGMTGRPYLTDQLPGASVLEAAGMAVLGAS